MMNTTYSWKLCHPTSECGDYLTSFAKKELLSLGISPVLIQSKYALSAITSGDADVAVLPLSEVPLDKPDGVVVTAVSTRISPADVLLIKAERATDGLLKLPHQAKVGVSDERQALQLPDFRADLQVEKLTSATYGEQYAYFQQSDLAAWLVPKFVIKMLALDFSNLVTFEFNPREFLPAAGQGVLAWCTTAHNLPLRRALKPLHHADVSSCTNVERTCLGLIKGNKEAFGIYCHRDANYNYHAMAAIGTSYHSISQSTTVGLAARLASMFS